MGACAGRDRRSWHRRFDPFDQAAAVLMLALLVLVFATVKQYAVSNDEGLQHHYGELILAYYRSGFTDRSVFDFGNLYLYGGLFDIVAVLLAHILPFDPYDVRHVLSAVAGIGGVMATFAAARMVAGPRAGLLAALALTVCGVWYGGMFNHTQDIPFAAAIMGAMYFLLRATRDLPGPRRGDLLGFGILLGAALGLRAAGLVTLGYVPLALFLRSRDGGPPDWRQSTRAFAVSMAQFIPALGIAYIIMIASWPWASLDVLNPARAIFAFAHFNYPVRTVLAGKVYLMSEVPRWYEPAYLAIKLPLLVLIGAAAGLLSMAWPLGRIGGAWKTARGREIALLAFAAGFPVLCHVIGHGLAFTGMRHFLFVLPPLAALAGIGIDTALSLLEQRGRALGMTAVAAVAVAFAVDGTALVRLHPYEYLFYNSLVGGLEGASRRYDTDYWVNIMPEAVQDLETYVARKNPPAAGGMLPHYSVGVCGERVTFDKEANQQLRWTPDWDHADFFIAPTQMNCDEVLRGKVVAVIKRVGVRIGVVMDLRGIAPQARWARVEVAHAGAGGADRPAKPHG